MSYPVIGIRLADIAVLKPESYRVTFASSLNWPMDETGNLLRLTYGTQQGERMQTNLGLRRGYIYTIRVWARLYTFQQFQRELKWHRERWSLLHSLSQDIHFYKSWTINQSINQSINIIFNVAYKRLPAKAYFEDYRGEERLTCKLRPG